jgi:hypothetical protein
MLIQQQYYTSWSNPRTKRTGFQVKAESPHLTPEIIATLNSLIGYSIPTQADASDLKNHPVALRYYTDEQIAVLVSSLSSGKDELGRDGNFFAHSLVGTPEQLAYPLAPIFYWDSPFWVSQDPSDQEQLAQLEQLDAEVTFDFDAVWNFLNEGDRKQQLYKLLCAVIDYQQSKRKIVIVDDNQSIALWIACVCTVLPPSHCYFLSFSTYHHDPGRTPFIITGTSADSYFRCTTDAYISNFILNAHDNTISEAPASDYALYVADRLTCDLYEEEVLEFFNWLERIDPTPKLIERYLDQYINFYQFSRSQTNQHDFQKLMDAAVFVKNIILKKTSLEQEDVVDLRAVCDLLANAVLNQPASEVIAEYSHSLRSLKKYDSCFSTTFNQIIRNAASFVLEKQQQVAAEHFRLIAELYSPDLFRTVLKQPETISTWIEQLNTSDIEQISVFWQFLAHKIHFEKETEIPLQNILLKTFASLDSQSSNQYKISSSVAEVIVWLTTDSKIPKDFLLKMAADYQSGKESFVLQWIYYALVENVSLSERQVQCWKYLHLLPDQASNLCRYEIRRDLLSSHNSQSIIQTLRAWTSLVDQALEFDLLNDAVQFASIFADFASHLRICKVDNLTLNLYQKLILQLSTRSSRLCQAIERLQTDQNYHIILQGAIELTQGKLQRSTILQLHTHLKSVNRNRYQEEAKALLEEFFVSRIDPDSHFKVIQGVYIQIYRDEFWNLYWSIFQSHLIEQSRISDIVNILDLWFNSSGDLIDRHPYVVPEFFAELPSLIDSIRSSKNYNRIERDFKAALAKKDWNPIVQKHLQKSRKRFLGNLF